MVDRKHLAALGGIGIGCALLWKHLSRKNDAVDDRNVAVIVHGGAWAIPDKLKTASIDGTRKAADAGMDILQNGGSAIDAVEAAIRILEDLPAFDAGTGSVLNRDREVEMDAMIMDGKSLRGGAVAAVQGVKNPISLARSIMDKTSHCLLVGSGARAYATEIGIPITPTEDLVTVDATAEWERYNSLSTNKGYRNSVSDLFSSECSHDTVGAVALDKNGNLASGTSTGGITMKRPGRVGDSPVIGSGGYADDTLGALSATGHGEALMRYAVCLRALMAYCSDGRISLSSSLKGTLVSLWQRVRGRGGLIGISPSGEIGHWATTEKMVWASSKAKFGASHASEFSIDGGFDNEDAFSQLS